MKLKKNFSSFLAVFILVFIAGFIYSGINATWMGMERSVNKFYQRNNTADFWIYGTFKANTNLVDDIKNMKKVTDVEKKLYVNSKDLSKDGGNLKLNFIEDNKISKSQLLEGEKFDPSKDGIWIDKFYAKEHKLKPGDSLKLSYLNTKKDFKIRGIIINPEYIFYLASDDNLLPEYKNFGYAYLSYNKNIFGKDKIYNEILVKAKDENISLTRQNDGSIYNNIKEQIEKDKFFDDYLLLNRKINPSFYLTEDKIDQFRSVSKLFPILFFITSMLVMSISIVRLIKSNKYEIGVMQSLGFKDKAITSYYLIYGLILVLPASLMGYFLGKSLIPPYIFKAMNEYYKIDKVVGYLENSHLIIIIISLILSLLSVYISVKVNLNSDIVSNLKNLSYQKEAKLLDKFVGRLEATKIWSSLSFTNIWIIKHLKDFFLRSMTYIFTFSLAMMLILSALNIKDSVAFINKWNFEILNTYKTKLVLKEGLKDENIKNLEDKYQAYPLIEERVEVRLKDKKLTKSLRVFQKENPLINLKDSHMKEVKLDDKGIYLSEKLKNIENIKNGDTIYFRKFSEKNWHKEKVVGFFRQAINQGLVIEKGLYEKYYKDFKAKSLVTKNQK